jgi:hypothetical protein
MIAALCFTFLLMWSCEDGGHHDAGPSWPSLEQSLLPAIPVAVFAAPNITDSLVRRICAEADAIWKPAGLAFEWHRVTPTDMSTRWLDVTIDDRRRDVNEERAVLGWIAFTADGARPSIYLSRSDAEALLVLTPGVEDKTLSSHERLLGRALGRALSHELGHYFLKSKSHTPHGLMQAVRPSEEFFRIGRDEFAPGAEARAAAALQVNGRRRPSATRAEESDDGGFRTGDH